MPEKTDRREISRRAFLQTAAASAALAALPGFARSAEPLPLITYKPGDAFLPAPKDPALWPTFQVQLREWRESMRAQLNYRDTLYRRPEFQWCAENFACCFVMLCDEAFYDHRRGRWRVREFLRSGQRDFGGYDSLVLWHAYPRIGADPRNQFDYYRDLPGGLPGVRRLVKDCHSQGVRVFIDYNPWDTGTRREPLADTDALAGLIRAIDADGIFLDTLSEGAAEFRGKLDAARPGVVLESEILLPLDRVRDHHASWAQNFWDGEVPGVLPHKLIEPRHMQHQVHRWRRDHTMELQAAWMNGSGILVWENVFGSWMGWSARDRSLLRGMLPIQRRFASLFSSGEWTPLAPTQQAGIFASRWSGGNLRLWTLVNRSEKPVKGELLSIHLPKGDRCFDLMAGREIPRSAGGAAQLSAEIPARGLGCFLAGSEAELGKGFGRFLASQAALWKRFDPDPQPVIRPVSLAAVKPTRPCPTAPAGMLPVALPSHKTLTVRMRPRECGFYAAHDKEDPGYWSGDVTLTRPFEFPLHLKPFAIDETPVTNAQFADFLRAARYRPEHPEQFLAHWPEGRLPENKHDHPVVWVDLEDARAYARWAGKRLPTELEWQVAAQGPEARRWPWGDTLEPGRCNTGETGGTTPVKAFPAGRALCGAYDFCGNVWQWTESERTDGRTRFCSVRGGCWFQARGSNWYFNGGPQPADYSAKFLLMWPGLDRCATIGFRCVVDLA